MMPVTDILFNDASYWLLFHWWWMNKWAGASKALGEKPVPKLLCQIPIPRGLIRGLPQSFCKYLVYIHVSCYSINNTVMTQKSVCISECVILDGRCTLCNLTVLQRFIAAELNVLRPYTKSRISWTLKRGLIDCPKMSVRNYRYVPRNIQEERRAHE
jgi:hypothetical protein